MPLVTFQVFCSVATPLSFYIIIATRGGIQQDTAAGAAPAAVDDYERAEKAVLSAIAMVEDKVQKAVAAEVDTLFHKTTTKKQQQNDKKADVAAKAKKAVEHAADKVKRAVTDYDRNAAEHEQHWYPFEMYHPYRFEHPEVRQKGTPEAHKDHRILHAVESAEKAVLQAVRDEVDTIFHDLEHHNDHKETVAQAKTSVKKGVQKATAKVKDIHEHRRGWLSSNSTSLIEAYAAHEFFLE